MRYVRFGIIVQVQSSQNVRTKRQKNIWPFNIFTQVKKILITIKVILV